MTPAADESAAMEIDIEASGIGSANPAAAAAAAGPVTIAEGLEVPAASASLAPVPNAVTELWPADVNVGALWFPNWQCCLIWRLVLACRP